LLKVDIAKLVPLYLSREEQIRIREVVRLLGKPKAKLRGGDLVLI
jgi:hypothetical protein